MVDETELEQTSTAPENDEQAQSSSAESETEDDLLAVVKAAVETEDPVDTDSQSDEVESDEEDEETDESEDFEEDDSEEASSEEEATDVPFNKHPRFRKLIAERNELRPKAEQYDQITGYLKTNGLTADEAAKGFEIMALMKNDPAAAVQALQPYLQNLSLATGHTLPDDIQQRLDDGYLDEDDAREMARLRAENQRSDQRFARMQEAEQRSRYEESQNNAASAVVAWETKTRSNDPDYDLKADELDDRVRVIMAERRASGNDRPLSPDEAVSIAQQAYNEVNKRSQARLGGKRPIRTASGGKLGGTPTPEPNSLMEAVQNALVNSA